MTDESDVERDVGQKDGEAHNLPTEFLDDTDDAHAFGFGAYKGFWSLRPNMEYSESFKNPHYFKIGYIFGYVVKVALAAWFGTEFVLPQ